MAVEADSTAERSVWLSVMTPWSPVKHRDDSVSGTAVSRVAAVFGHLAAIQKRTLSKNMLYQTLISSLLHKYAAGRLKEV